MEVTFQLVTKHEFLLKPYNRPHATDYHQNIYYFFRIFSKGYYVGDIKLYLDIEKYEGRIDTIYINKMFREDWLYDRTLNFIEAFFRLKECTIIVVEATSDIKDWYLAKNYTINKDSYLQNQIVPILIQDADIKYLADFIKENGLYDSLKIDENLFEDIFEEHVRKEDIL